MSRTTGGFLAGADMPAGENARIGIAGGHTRTALGVPQRGSSLSSNDDYAGLYAGGSVGALALSAGADYTRHRADTTRRVAMADAGGSLYNRAAAHTAEFYGNAAYRMAVNNAIVEPFAQVAYVKLATDSFKERDGSMALAVSGSQRAVLYTTLGTRAATHFVFQGDAFNAYASAGWRHVSGDLRARSSLALADARAFAVSGLPIARNALALSAGVDVAVNKSVRLGLSYDAQIAPHTTDASLRAQLSWRF
jgi:outer membrane autotransporter protein